MSLVGRVERILDFVAWICMLFAGISLVVLIVIFGWLVFGRYVMNDTPTWVEQAALLLIAYISFIGAAVGVRNNAHLNIDFIREALPRVPRDIMRSISDLVVIVFGVFMAWQGYVLVVQNTRRMIPMIDLSEAWRAAPVLIGGALIVVFCAFNIVKRLASPGEIAE